MSAAQTNGPTQEHLDEFATLTGDEAGRYWLEHIYQGDNARQLTVRAVVTGMLIGGIMSISNLYVGLKSGWGLGVTITACIIAFAVFNALQRVIPAYRSKHFTILENYTMSSAASAAGYMSSAGLVSAVPALYLATGRQLTAIEMMTWVGSISMLGVFMAIPLKRQMINIDRLPFPSGIATAETLRSMHSSGAEALSKARALIWGALLGALVEFWKNGIVPLVGWIQGVFAEGWTKEYAEAVQKRFGLPDDLPLFPGPQGESLLKKLTFGFEGSLIMVGAGAIMGIRVGLSLLIGAIIFYGVIGNYLVDHGITEPGKAKKGIMFWTLWPSTAMMVTAGLLSFAMKWRTILRAFHGLARIVGGSDEKEDALNRVEVPGSWFAMGTIVFGAITVYLGHRFFDISWWMGTIAVLLTFVLSIVAARATGETDVTPVGAMGKITQLTYGVLAPSNMTTNLMTASITAGVASHSADLLTDLKSGYLLGGNPRKQTISQLFGVIAGTLFCVPVYLVVATPEKFDNNVFAAPAAKTWEAVARVLADGIGALPRGAREAIVIGALVGVILTLAEEYLPKKYKKWLPSVTGLGIAGVIPAHNAISMFLGSLIAWIFFKLRPALAERFTIPFSSGLIAGETLLAVTLIFIKEGPGMIRELSQYLVGS